MFGIGGGELVFIILIALMLFGADKIPDIARTLGKGMAQLKNATNDIKSEITNSVEKHDFDIKTLSYDFKNEVEQVKQSVTKTIENVKDDSQSNSSEQVEPTDIEDISGPIKRRM